MNLESLNHVKKPKRYHLAHVVSEFVPVKRLSSELLLMSLINREQQQNEIIVNHFLLFSSSGFSKKPRRTLGPANAEISNHYIPKMRVYD